MSPIILDVPKALNKCTYCGEELSNNQMWFCDIECEKSFREDNEEFHAIVKDEFGDESIEEICPIVDFINEEDSDMISVNNGNYNYGFKKSNIIKWEITQCDCLIEFMDIEPWCNTNKIKWEK